MAGVSPGASFSADSAPSIDTLKDLHEHCMSTFELLRSDPNCSSQRWREQFINLRDWGGSLSQDSYDPSVFINRLRNSAPLRDAIRNHLNALLAILRQANGQDDADTPKSFKIAGIDVLTSPSSSKQEDEGARRLSQQFSVIHKCVTDLGIFQHSPNALVFPDQLRPQTTRSASSIDDPKDASDLSSAASISPLAAPSQANRSNRRYSIPNAASEQIHAQQISPGTDSLARQLQAMPASTQRLSPTSSTETTLPPLSQTLPPAPHPQSAGPRLRSPYETSQYPLPQPQAPPIHPYGGPNLPPPQQMTFSQYPQPPPPPGYPTLGTAEKRPPKRPPSMTGPAPADQPPPRVMPTAPHRLLIPNQQGEDPGSAVTPSPKLTKTGRVSKALRGEPVHACNICDKVYTRAEHLRRHRSNHRVNLLRSAPPGPSGT